VFKLERDPSPLIDSDDAAYNSGSSSSFGAPNSWSGGANNQNFNAFNTTNAPAVLTWDVTPGNGTAQDGAGTWSNGTGNWFNASSTSDDTWENAQPDSAVFGSGGAGSHTVTLGSAIETGNLTFEAGPTYTLTGADLTVHGNILANESAEIASNLTTTATGARIEVAQDKTLTVSGQLLGTDDFEIGGEGTVIFSADNSAFNDTITVTNDSRVEFYGDLDVTSLLHVKSEAKLVIDASAIIGDVLIDSGSKVRIEGDGTIGGRLDMDDSDAKVRGHLIVMDKVEILKGMISPGDSNSPGILVFQDDLTIGDGGGSGGVLYTWQLFDNTDIDPGVNFDQVTVGDQLRADEADPQDPDFTQMIIDIEMRDNVDMSNPFWNAPHSWNIMDVTRQDNFNIDMLSIGDVLDPNDNPLVYDGDFSLAIAPDGSVRVHYAPIPEPSTIVLLAAGALVLLIWRRRRK